MLAENRLPLGGLADDLGPQQLPTLEKQQQEEEHMPFASDDEDATSDAVAFFGDDDSDLGCSGGGGSSGLLSAHGARDTHSFVHLLETAPKLRMFSSSSTEVSGFGGPHGGVQTPAGQLAPPPLQPPPSQSATISIEDELRECQLFGQTLRTPLT
jgi:hypothetical protein